MNALITLAWSNNVIKMNTNFDDFHFIRRKRCTFNWKIRVQFKNAHDLLDKNVRQNIFISPYFKLHHNYIINANAITLTNLSRIPTIAKQRLKQYV